MAADGGTFAALVLTIVSITLLPLNAYKILKKDFMRDVKGAANAALISECISASIAFVSGLPRESLHSLVSGKEYFAFAGNKGKLSRAVNVSLYTSNFSEWEALNTLFERDKITELSPNKITEVIYTAAMSFCCYIDLLHSGDQKTPGTFFEYLISHLFARKLDVNPERSVQVLNLDKETHLPTDFVFNLGSEKAKFHLPVKTSTRERVIQVWAHQRVLDGVFGTGRFIGTPVILTETKTGKAKKDRDLFAGAVAHLPDAHRSLNTNLLLRHACCLPTTQRRFPSDTCQAVWRLLF